MMATFNQRQPDSFLSFPTKCSHLLLCTWQRPGENSMRTHSVNNLSEKNETPAGSCDGMSSKLFPKFSLQNDLTSDLSGGCFVPKRANEEKFCGQL